MDFKNFIFLGIVWYLSKWGVLFIAYKSKNEQI